MATVSLSSKSAEELGSYIHELQTQTLNIIIAVLGLSCVILFSLGFQNPDNQWFFIDAFGLLVFLGMSYFLSKYHFGLASTWVIVACLFVIYITVSVGGVQTALVLLVIPAGLATLILNIWGGAVFAGISSLLLLILPFSFLPVSTEMRWACTAEIWAATGIIWLALRPLLRFVEWTWTAYEESQESLKLARDSQGHLKQALEDAFMANQQLARLNKLAQDLRQIAENERQMKQEFVANVSHELRTPLNMIIGFCEVILKKPQAYGKRPLPPMLLADLEVVLRNSQHLSELIDDVLDLSQVDAGKMALLKERVSIREIVEAAVIAIHPLFESKGLYLETDVAADLPLVYCDRTRIREVILNLLSNAGRFTVKGGVTIKVYRQENNLFVAVTDTGTGMTDEVKNKLFQPFQQADASIHQRYGGTGLGLAISKSFVELHDGKMWVESQPGAGTSFYFQLPINPPIPLKTGPLRWLNQWSILKERTRAPSSVSGKVKPRLMVVEQGDVMQHLLNRYVQDIDVDSMEDLGSALENMSQHPAQALLINTLPIEKTLSLLSQPSILPYNTPAIICSIPGIEQASAALGANNYLVKPISEDALLAAIEQIEQPIQTILLVDDEPDAIQLFRRMLLSAGKNYRVLRAMNGRQALEILQHENADVILLDLTMPEMDGYQFLDIKNQDARLCSIPVILISARDPGGQPIASNALAVTRGGGLSAGQIMDCMEAFISILAPSN
jgi:signal transduction histidine kinase/CheY-like chemotaxis protein